MTDIQVSLYAGESSIVTCSHKAIVTTSDMLLSIICHV